MRKIFLSKNLFGILDVLIVLTSLQMSMYLLRTNRAYGYFEFIGEAVFESMVFLGLSFFFLLIFQYNGLYRVNILTTRAAHLSNFLKSLYYGALDIVIISLLFSSSSLLDSRYIIFVFLIIVIPSFYIFRIELMRTLFVKLSMTSFKRNVLISGDGKAGKMLASQLMFENPMGLEQGGCPALGNCTNLKTTTPNLGALANNGGCTQTMAISAGSSALNACGVNFACAPTDQRGISRPQGSACDIGAFELDSAGVPVTINQAAGQADPTNSSPINFTVVFSEAVSGFATGDVTPTGSAGATTATITESAPNNGTTYNVAVSGMTSDGTIIVSVPAGVAVSGSSIPNNPSSSTDNTVTYRGRDRPATRDPASARGGRTRGVGRARERAPVRGAARGVRSIPSEQRHLGGCLRPVEYLLALAASDVQLRSDRPVSPSNGRYAWRSWDHSREAIPAEAVPWVDAGLFPSVSALRTAIEAVAHRRSERMARMDLTQADATAEAPIHKRGSRDDRPT